MVIPCGSTCLCHMDAHSLLHMVRIKADTSRMSMYPYRCKWMMAVDRGTADGVSMPSRFIVGRYDIQQATSSLGDGSVLAAVL